MIKQFKNNEGRVFKESYSPYKLADRLWNLLNYYKQLYSDVDLSDTSFEFGVRYATKEAINIYHHREKMIKDKINDIREKNGLPYIPRSSLKWYYKSEIIKGIIHIVMLSKIINFIIMGIISFIMFVGPAILTVIAGLQHPIFIILTVFIAAFLITCFVCSIIMLYNDIFGDKK